MRLPGGPREAWVVVDLGFGDQGKGSIVDFLVRDRGAHTVVRYNGGAQAAHNVVTDDGRHHTFAQFGAGSFVAGAQTVLASTVAIQPWSMLVEAEHLARAGVTDAFARTLIADDCVVVTPFHRAANRLRELARGADRHGSCGVGVGEAVSDARAGAPTIRARDLADARTLIPALARIQAYKAAELAHLHVDHADPDASIAIAELTDRRMPTLASVLLEPFRKQARVVDAMPGSAAIDAVFRASGAIVFEGAHGVLLDEDVGFHPYTTWSSCTSRHAHALLAAHGFDGDVRTLGVVRAYATRHGPGPFVSEDAALGRAIREAHNAHDRWQGAFRVGWPDAVMTRYALAADGRVDALAVTCLDQMPSAPDFASWSLASEYAIGGARARDLQPGRDLASQAALTQILQHDARPSYRSIPTDRDTLLATLEDETGTRVVLTSDGPTASAKRWRVDRA